MSIKAPRLIRDRCGVYYFRLIVPLSWRDAVKKTEIRRSLRTKDAAIARQAALLLSARMEVLVANSKNTLAGKGEVTVKQEQQLFGWMKETEAKKMLVRQYSNGEVHIETDTPEEAKEARAIVKDLAAARKHAAIGEGMAVLPVSRSGMVLEAAKVEYLTQCESTLAKGTLPKVRGALSAFIAFAGNVDLALARAASVRSYKQKMLADKKAATTINDHIGILAGFFDYCIDNKIVAMDNPARGLLIPGAANKAESYDPFTDEELAKIFQPVTYLKKMRLPDFYWGPLIALFTGMRAEEIASLELDQIRQEKGIWIIDIWKGKTDNAERRVPIHQRLLDLGLTQYAASVRGAGYARLFPHALDGKNGCKKNMCRTFGEYLDMPELNIVSPLKVFHSFRHTVVTHLTDKGVNEGQKRAMVGHDIDSRNSAHDDYTHLKALTLANLQIAINKLDYEGIDFSKLKVEPDTFLPAIAKRIKQQDERKLRDEAKQAQAKKKSKPKTESM